MGNVGAFVVATGFALRWAFGTFALAIDFSWWAIVLIVQLALFMLAGKRFQSNKRSTQFQNAGEEHDYWLLSLVVYAALFLATYASFISQQSVQEYWGQHALLTSTLPIGIGIARYLEIVTHPSKYETEDSTETMLRDKTLMFLGFTFITILYLGKIFQN